jgi:hypothetical protein
LICGETNINEEVHALGHTYTSEKTDATCTTDGKIVYTCACGESYEEVIKATGEHTYGDAVVTPAKPGVAGANTYTCTVCGDVKEEAIEALPAVAFAGASLGLKSNITFNFYVYETLLANNGYTNAYVTFQVGSKSATVDTYTTTQGMRVYAFSDIAPHQMNDKVHAVLHVTYNGEEYTGFIDYAIIDYVNSQFSKLTSTDNKGETRALLVDLLNYGAATQIYANSNVNNLANANLTEEQKSWGTQADVVPENILNQEYAVIDNPTATVAGAALVLKDAIVIRTYITAPTTEGVSIQIKAAGKTWNYTAKDFTAQSGMYYVDFNGLNPAQMKNAVDITVLKDGVAISNTTRYSIETYAAIQFTKEGVDAKLINLLKAMLKYGVATYNYAN